MIRSVCEAPFGSCELSTEGSNEDMLQFLHLMHFEHNFDEFLLLGKTSVCTELETRLLARFSDEQLPASEQN